MRLVMVRHGQTTDNHTGVLSGQRDVQLSETGHDQARAVAEYLARHLPPDVIASSDLQRARDTARCISERCALPAAETCGWLRERHAGVLQGLTKQQMKQQQRATHRRWKSDDDDATIEDGETRRDFRQRVQRGVTALARENSGKTVVLVSHAGVLREVFNLVFDTSENGNALRCENAALCLFRFELNLWSMERWGDDGYKQYLASA